MKRQDALAIAFVLGVSLWVFIVLTSRRKKVWRQGEIMEVVSVKPLNKPTVHAVKFKGLDGARTYLTTQLPNHDFQYRILGEDKMVMSV